MSLTILLEMFIIVKEPDLNNNTFSEIFQF